MKPKLLVVELWGVGDLTIATPFLRAASEEYDVTLLARPYARDLQVRLWPAVRVVPFTAPWTAFQHKYRLFSWPWREMYRLGRRLRKERFTVGLSARWDPRDHFLLKLCGAKTRLGFPRMGSQVFLTQALARPDPEAHRGEHWRVIAEALNLRLPARGEIPLPERRSKGVVLVHSGAGQPVRVWPLDYYRKLVGRLRALQYTVQVACDPDQQTWWQQTGETGVATPRTVAELLVLSDRAGVFIGNDSGPGHVAAFNGVPTFTLFGPQLPEWFAPLHPGSEWIEGRACPYKPCSDYCRFPLPHCLWGLSEEAVWPKVEAFIARHADRLAPAAPAVSAKKSQPGYHTARPLHFLQIFNRYLMPGGEENSVARIALHLESAGHEVTRYWRSSADWLGPDAPPKWRQATWALNNTPLLNQLREVHARVRPDAWVLHNLVPVMSKGVFRLAIELKVPVIRWLHNYRPISPSGTLRAWGRALEPDDPWISWKEAWAGTWRGTILTTWLLVCYRHISRRRILEAVNAWVAISEEMKRIFIRGGFPAEKMHVLRHSWDIQPRVQPGKDEGYFLYLGRMVEEKGARFLIRLWRRPELKGIPLVMAGLGPVADKHRDRTGPNIRWAGFVRGEEKRRLVAGSRAVLFPCLWPEPLGTVVYEAYEQARPVLGSNLGGLKDLIADDQTGRLLKPGDEAAWIEAIQELARQPELSRTMGERGLEWLNQNVSPDDWNRRFDEIVRQIMP